jgi:Arc/MetJ-type ribon-helix-helix transcriptional regulator
MSALTIRVPEETINEINKRSKKLHITRSEYVRKSIEIMNKQFADQERRERMIQISKKVREESMVVNAEFEKIEHDIKN